MVTKQDGKSSLIDFVANPRLFSALHKKKECNNSAVMNENIRELKNLRRRKCSLLVECVYCHATKIK